jgi:hypothetical protein
MKVKRVVEKTYVLVVEGGDSRYWRQTAKEVWLNLKI